MQPWWTKAFELVHFYITFSFCLYFFSKWHKYYLAKSKIIIKYITKIKPENRKILHFLPILKWTCNLAVLICALWRRLFIEHESVKTLWEAFAPQWGTRAYQTSAAISIAIQPSCFRISQAASVTHTAAVITAYISLAQKTPPPPANKVVIWPGQTANHTNIYLGK